MSLKHKIISGVKWNTAGKISNQVLQFLLSVILMRVLDPSDYGLLAMAMVLIGFAGIFSEFGFSSALIQNQSITEKHKSSIFWLNVIIGGVLTLLFFFLAKVFAGFYENYNLTIVIKYLSFSFLISSISIVPSTLLQKEMNYSAINKIDVSIVILSGILSVYLAINGWGVMSLVFQYLLSQLLKIPFVFYSSNWHPKFIFSRSSIKELFSYSAYLTGFNFINYWARKSDDLLVGKFMGANSLGIYSRAYSLMLLPITHVIGLVSNVIFPAFSAIQEDKNRIKGIYLNVIQVISFFTFPLMIGIIPTAENFVVGIFGNKWVEVTPIIQILAAVGVTQTLVNPTGWIYTSQAKTNWMFWWGLIASTSVIVVIAIGVIIGSIYSVAVAYLIINFVLMYPAISIPGKLINLKFSEVVMSVMPIFLISMITGAFIYLTGIILPDTMTKLIQLIIQMFIGILVYLGCMRLFKVKAFNDIIILLKEHKTQNSE